MDARQDRLQRKLEDLLRQATAVAAELQGVEQGSGTPHYDQIEMPAHALGQKLSRMIQSERAREVAAAGLAAAEASCPTCGRRCRVETVKREAHSVDGPLELLETVAKCRPCRRSFFPSAG